MEKEEVRFIPKGLLRPLIMIILNEQPTHGYELIKKIKERTGFWKPSPGTIYPVLKSMVENDLIEEIKTTDLKIKYRLTRKGKKLVRTTAEIKHRMKKNLASFLSETMDANKSEINKKIEGHFKDVELLQLLQTEVGMLIAIRSDKKKLAKAKKIIEQANRKLGKLVDCK